MNMIVIGNMAPPLKAPMPSVPWTWADIYREHVFDPERGATEERPPIHVSYVGGRWTRLAQDYLRAADEWQTFGRADLRKECIRFATEIVHKHTRSWFNKREAKRLLAILDGQR
jgi:hypothetical protein